MDLAATVVGAIILIGGLSVVVVGYDNYLTQEEIGEQIQQAAEEMGLDDIPGVDSNREFALAIIISGVVAAIFGSILLGYGLLRGPEPGPPRHQIVPGAANFCDRCGGSIPPNGVSCPGCGRQLRSGE